MHLKHQGFIREHASWAGRRWSVLFIKNRHFKTNIWSGSGVKPDGGWPPKRKIYSHYSLNPPYLCPYLSER